MLGLGQRHRCLRKQPFISTKQTYMNINIPPLTVMITRERCDMNEKKHLLNIM